MNQQKQVNRSFIINNPISSFYNSEQRPSTTGQRQRYLPQYSASQIRQKTGKQSSPPQSLLKDKEYLYDENLQLKSALNTIKDEFQLIKIRNLQLERELLKYEKLLDERNRSSDFGNNQIDKQSLVLKLRQKQKEQQIQLLDKIRELESFKKSVRTTKFYEIETELDLYKQETIRLRQQLNHSIRALDLSRNRSNEGSTIQEQYLIQEANLRAITKDNYNLSNHNKDLQTQNQQFKLRFEEMETTIMARDKEIQRLQKLLIEQQKAINEKLKSTKPAKSKNQKYYDTQKFNEQEAQHLRDKQYLEKESQKQIKSKQDEIDFLQKHLKLKQTQVDELEKQFQYLTNKQRQDTPYEQQVQLLKSISKQAKINNEIASQDEIIPHQPPLQEQSKSPINRRSILLDSQVVRNRTTSTQQKESSMEKSIESVSMIKVKSQQEVQFNLQLQQVSKKKLPKVNFHDVQDIGYKIRLELLREQITFQEVEDHFVQGDVQELSIEQVKDIFRKEPYNINNENHLTLISRYLVEDNSEDYVLYDENLTNDIAIIKSVLKKLIGRYTLFTQDEEENLKSEMIYIFTKFGQSLVDTIQGLIIKKKFIQPGTCEYSDLETAFKFCDAILSPRQTEYLKMTIYKQSGDLNKVYFQKLKDLFQIKDMN